MAGSGGVCLTFDDYSVQDWLAADPMLARYGARATYFVSHFPGLGEDAVAGLHALARRGNEIGCHSVNHLNALAFLETGSVDGYLAAEVFPAVERMRAARLEPVSYCYPFNAHNDILDGALSPYFRVLRGRADAPVTPFHPVSGNRVLAASSIDLHVQNVTIPRTLTDIEAELRAARDSGRVVVYYGHRISNQPVAHHHISLWGLEYLVHTAATLGLTFHTASELA